MDDKKVKFSTRNPSELVPNEDNPRHMTRVERNKLAQSLKEFGFVDPVVINTYPGRENRIIGGHQRVEAAKGIGLESVPVAEVCLSKEKESILNIALNRITGAWDEDKHVKIMMELNANQENLLATGFSEHELDRLMGPCLKNRFSG